MTRPENLKWPDDPRQKPLRRVVDRIFTLDAGTWAKLECGHITPVDGTAGMGKRARCETCKFERLRARRAA